MDRVHKKQESHASSACITLSHEHFLRYRLRRDSLLVNDNLVLMHNAGSTWTNENGQTRPCQARRLLWYEQLHIQIHDRVGRWHFCQICSQKQTLKLLQEGDAGNAHALCWCWLYNNWRFLEMRQDPILNITDHRLYWALEVRASIWGFTSAYHISKKRRSPWIIANSVGTISIQQQRVCPIKLDKLGVIDHWDWYFCPVIGSCPYTLCLILWACKKADWLNLLSDPTHQFRFWSGGKEWLWKAVTMQCTPLAGCSYYERIISMSDCKHFMQLLVCKDGAAKKTQICRITCIQNFLYANWGMSALSRGPGAENLPVIGYEILINDSSRCREAAVFYAQYIAFKVSLLTRPQRVSRLIKLELGAFLQRRWHGSI